MYAHVPFTALLRGYSHTCSFLLCSRELDEQAEDLHDMYEKRVQLLQRSVKKSVSRKRRRPNDEGVVN